jgi:hypothetical protein
MRCYSHLSDDEREQIGLLKALGLAGRVGRKGWGIFWAAVFYGQNNDFEEPSPYSPKHVPTGRVHLFFRPRR